MSHIRQKVTEVFLRFQNQKNCVAYMYLTALQTLARICFTIVKIWRTSME